MMGALQEIQRKGDNMLASIKRQREVLERLERKAELAERKREEAEILARQMEDKKQRLEDDLEELSSEKESLMVKMKDDESEISRFLFQDVICSYLLYSSPQGEVRPGTSPLTSIEEESRTREL